MSKSFFKIAIMTVFLMSYFCITNVSAMCLDYTKDNKIGLEDSIYASQVILGLRAGQGDRIDLSHEICILRILAGIGIMPDSPACECYTLIWSDEFDENSLNTDKWRYEPGGTGFGNAELQYYRPENILVENGILIITAKKEDYQGKNYTSGRITTAGLHSFKYGIIESRIKLTHGAGMWPAFWMLGDSFFKNGWPGCGEIDIIETGDQNDVKNKVDDRTSHSTVHYADQDGNHQYSTNSFQITQPYFDEDYHIFGVKWDDQKIIGYVDNNQYFTFDIKNSASTEEFNQHFYLILNLAVGGYYTGITEPNKGDLDQNFPYSIYVDWVRVYQKTGQDYLKGDGTGNFPPSGGDFVIVGEHPADRDVAGQIALDVNANLYIWNNLTSCTPSLSKSLCFTGKAGDWSGFGIQSAYSRDLSAYEKLHIKLRTSSDEPFKIGVKSDSGITNGESWIFFNPGNFRYDFFRDGQWHEIVVPLSDFQRTDFSHITQFFMLATSMKKLYSDFPVEIDGVYFIDSDPSTKPKTPCNNYIVFNETICGSEQFIFDSDGSLDVWKDINGKQNIVITDSGNPYEGAQAWKMTAQPGTWFGAGMSLKTPKNMLAYSDRSLHVSLKTSSQHPFKIGISCASSGGKGDSWVYFNPGRDPYYFSRDGQWHEVVIPFTDFQRTDFINITQLFMIAGESPASQFVIEVDNIFWENHKPGDAPLPNPIIRKNYVIYSETTGGTDYYIFDTDGQLQRWTYSNVIVTEDAVPYEGNKAWKFNSADGKWVGIGISLNNFKDMNSYSNGYLVFSLKTSSNISFKIGIKNGLYSESWKTFTANADPYGFLRDGKWHRIAIPLKDFGISLNSVSQLFMLSASDNFSSSPPFSIEVDDLYWSSDIVASKF